MRNFRISDNKFRGTIPDFIENWTELENLVLFASGLAGPIPPSIARLTKLKDLMISDLTGPESSFPPLQSMKRIRILVLRNSKLKGELPWYLGTNATNLTLLDLSFNKLTGAIPSTYEPLRDVENIYLTGNMLNGSIPSWMLKERDGDTIDLTYNKFSEDLTTEKCVAPNIDLFASSYQMANNSLSVFCLKSFQCPKSFSSLHINCGGDEVKINGTVFEADRYDRKPVLYDSTHSGWVLSNTGHFLDDHRVSRGTIWSDTSKLAANTDARLYADARLSAISLTYFAVCFQKGDYKVKLHFAEIMLSAAKSYKSLGRRYFDIYIQERLVLKDFNIADEAGGIGKAVVKTFPVTISNGTLQIRLYWAGKGTVSVPNKGVYGPLISAISVDQDFTGFQVNTSKQISLGGKIAIAVAAVVVLLLVIGSILWWCGCLGFKNQLERDLKSSDFNIKAFTLRQIKTATSNFRGANKIGEGGFGPVYKGVLTDGTTIAVKHLSEKSKQGNKEFLNEIGIISALQHPHLVKLHGCCVEGDQLLLVYEYMENNSLSRALFGPQHSQISLDWPTRKKICLGIARGLAYLHEESRLKILHRDIKAANILLDENLSPKISDFGLAKLSDPGESHISTNPAGTFGYLAPEYAMKGHLSDKSDVYSFGVLAMEIVYGKSNNTSRSDNTEHLFFAEWVRLMWEQGKLAEFVDLRLQSYDREEVLLIVKVAIVCTKRTPEKRPLMSVVVKMLEGTLAADIETRLADITECAEEEEQPLDLMRVMADIDAEFESEEKPETPETPGIGQRYLLSGKGKEKLSSDSFSFRAESSKAGADRE